MSADIIITGDKALDAKLKALPEKVQKKIARSALSQAMTIVRKAAIKATPVGKTGKLKMSIGKRFKTIKKQGITEAKVGISVGKSGSKAYEAVRYGHLVALGTGPRAHKSGKSTGIMPANPFFRQATESVESQVQEKMRSVILAKLEAEVSKR